MRYTALLRTLGLLVVFAALATGCGPVEALSDRASSYLNDSTRDRLAERSRESVTRLDELRDTDVEVVLSDTVTLEQLHEAGIPVGSHQIDCDQPLHVVVMNGTFDSDTLFDGGIPIHGSLEETLAMHLVAEIYDPETEEPLGMIGDTTGNSLNGLLQDSPVTGSGSGDLILDTSDTEQAGNLVPEAVCQ